METRPLTEREERRYAKQAARRFSHTCLWRECGVGFFCWTCAWRTVTGANERAMRAFRARADAIGPALTPVKIDLLPERVAEARQRGTDQYIADSGQVTCEGDHDFAAQNAVNSVDLWSCPACGAAV